MASELETFGHKQLLTEANADQWFAGLRNVLERSDQVALPQTLHGITEGANPREDHRICGKNLMFVGGNEWLQTNLFAGMFYTE
jgi:hypothetical protein